MEQYPSALAQEEEKLQQTLALVQHQLEEARALSEGQSSDIAALRKEMRENANPGNGVLSNNDDFESMVEMTQYNMTISQTAAAIDSTQRRMDILSRLLLSPYFARIDFLFDGDAMSEQIYIGRATLKDEGYAIAVYDWRSPVASMFYRFPLGLAHYEAPNGIIAGVINLKRQYEIKNGKLEYFFDADIHVIDEYLRKLLSQNASPTMKSIVETIQREQDFVIRDQENDCVMVQGVAGSGKSSIALHRAAWLMYQSASEKLEAKQILILSPNQLFERYISRVLPELGEENVQYAIFDEILQMILQTKHIQSRNQFLEYLMATERFRERMKLGVSWKTSLDFIQILDRYIADITAHQIPFEDVYYGEHCIVTKEALQDKINSGSKTIPLGLRLKLLGDYILDEAMEARRLYGQAQEYGRIKQEILRFTELSPSALYRALFQDSAYLYQLAYDMDLPGTIDDLLSSTREQLNAKILSYDDASCLAYFMVKLNGPGLYKDIRQVVIDEAQDYYPIHYALFQLLFPNAKYTIVGDMDQTVEKQEDLSLYARIREILMKEKSILVTMDKSFRSSSAIIRFCARFLPYGASIESFEREGSAPGIFSAPDQETLYEQIVQEVESSEQAGFQSIGLLCKTEKSATALHKGLMDKLGDRMVQIDVADEIRGIFVLPIYMAKGLEFDAVLVCDVSQENYYSEDDQKLLYIACARALHRLNLFHTGSVSPLLQRESSMV